MAATYWRGDDRTGSWWIKTYHPLTKALVRQSLETVEKSRADLICRRVELELGLRRPGICDVELPPKLAAALGLDAQPAPLIAGGASPAAPSCAINGMERAPISPPISEVLSEFVAYIRVENAPTPPTKSRT
jgi:hypothetical protein